MHYVKKMCILRQIRQGFSTDGNALSGLIKVEQYAKNLAVEVSKGTISINTPKSTKVAIVDMAGKQVWSGAIQGKKSIALPAGTYLVNNKKVLVN